MWWSAWCDDWYNWLSLGFWDTFRVADISFGTTGWCVNWNDWCSLRLWYSFWVGAVPLGATGWCVNRDNWRSLCPGAFRVRSVTWWSSSWSVNRNWNRSGSRWGISFRVRWMRFRSAWSIDWNYWSGAVGWYTFGVADIAFRSTSWCIDWNDWSSLSLWYSFWVRWIPFRTAWRSDNSDNGRTGLWNTFRTFSVTLRSTTCYWYDNWSACWLRRLCRARLVAWWSRCRWGDINWSCLLVGWGWWCEGWAAGRISPVTCVSYIANSNTKVFCITRTDLTENFISQNE